MGFKIKLKLCFLNQNEKLVNAEIMSEVKCRDISQAAGYGNFCQGLWHLEQIFKGKYCTFDNFVLHMCSVKN